MLREDLGDENKFERAVCHQWHWFSGTTVVVSLASD